MRLSDIFARFKKDPLPQHGTVTGKDTGIPITIIWGISRGSRKTPGPKKFQSSYRQYFSFFRINKLSAQIEYDYAKHGTLITGSVPEGYELLDQYWLATGQTLVYITLNKKTNQTDYLLFEPALSEFEYELLERLHQDLIDVLVLTTADLKKDGEKSCSTRCTHSLTIMGLRSKTPRSLNSSITSSAISSAGRVSIR